MTSRLLSLVFLFTLSACYSFEYDPTGGKDVGPTNNAQDMGEADQPADDMMTPDAEPDLPDPAPVVTITLPDEGAQVMNDVRLVALAFDKDQNNISSEVVWLKDGSLIQVGNDVTHTFALGPQTVTARVSDTAGNIGETEISFEVIE